MYYYSEWLAAFSKISSVFVVNELELWNLGTNFGEYLLDTRVLQGVTAFSYYFIAEFSSKVQSKWAREWDLCM